MIDIKNTIKRLNNIKLKYDEKQKCIFLLDIIDPICFYKLKNTLNNIKKYTNIDVYFNINEYLKNNSNIFSIDDKNCICKINSLISLEVIVFYILYNNDYKKYYIDFANFDSDFINKMIKEYNLREDQIVIKYLKNKKWIILSR